jgi:hypothetical protein
MTRLTSSAFAAAIDWRKLRHADARSSDRLLIPLIVAVALIARIVIIWSGGQFYWPDEDRYLQSRAMVEGLTGGETHQAASFEHHLFKVIGSLPAAIESMSVEDARIPAAFFALFSVVNISLLAGIARHLGAGAAESGFVALLFAASTSFLYFTRHLFPYDVSMTFGLLALRAAIMPETSWRASLVCGAWAGLCFFAYFGYWTLGGAACVIHVLRGVHWQAVIRRGVVTALGLATPLLLFGGLPSVMGGNVVSGTMEFMAKVNQGSYGEGWRVPFEYLWHAEHMLLVLWLAAVAACVAGWRRWRDVPAVRVGLFGLLFVYGTLAIFSTGFEAFVVYGRLARQLVPFFCLVTAAVLARGVRNSIRGPFIAAMSAAIVLQAALNAWPVFAQQFPREFVRRGEQVAGGLGASHPVSLYAAHLYPPSKIEAPTGYVEAFSARHPLQYKPYQYEGYTPQEREFLRSTDIRMRMLIPGEKR